jgi:hypothetical protein
MAINPVRLVLGPPCIDHDPGWAERVGAIGYPDAEAVSELAPDMPNDPGQPPSPEGPEG